METDYTDYTDYSDGTGVTLDEALNSAQRIKRKASMRRAAPKIKRGREKASRRKATSDTIMKRAMNRARKLMFNRLAKKEKGEMNFAARQAIEKKLAKKKPAIERLAKRIFKDVKRDDQNKMKKKEKKEENT